MEGDVSACYSESATVLRYRQRLEKSTGGEVVLMEWSPTADLLAVALGDHSVSNFCLLVWKIKWLEVFCLHQGCFV